MCCRYYTGEDTERELATLTGTEPLQAEQTLIRPTDSSRLLVSEQKLFLPASMSWGFYAAYPGKPVINARSETAAVKPMFADSLRRRRCVIPVSSFFEYNNRKEAVEFFHPEGELLFLAGIWRREAKGNCFTVLTTEANESVSRYHDRMPLLLTRSHLGDWLMEEASVQSLLREHMPQLRCELPNEQLSLF